MKQCQVCGRKVDTWIEEQFYCAVCGSVLVDSEISSPRKDWGKAKEPTKLDMINRPSFRYGSGFEVAFCAVKVLND